jgi:hypothetical protein
MGFWCVNEVGSSVDAQRRALLSYRISDSVPEYLKLSQAEIDAMWHATRVKEWSWALLEVEKIAKEKGEVNVLDVGCDPRFAALLMTVPGVTVTMHRTWCDTEMLGKFYGAKMLPFMEEYHARVRILVADPVNEIPRTDFDVVTNISVMEHLPGEMWKEWSDWSWGCLRSGGDYLLTLDWLTDGKGPIGGPGDQGMSNKRMDGLIRGEHTPPWEVSSFPGPPFQCNFWTNKERSATQRRDYICWGARMAQP